LGIGSEDWRGMRREERERDGRKEERGGRTGKDGPPL